MAPLPQWQENILFLSIIYAVKEKGHQLRVQLEGEDIFCQPILDEMRRHGLMFANPSTEVWEVTVNGDALRGQMVAMYDQLLKFEIFGSVNQALQLTVPDQSADGLEVHADILDPRFTPSPGSEDLRLAMLAWFSDAGAAQLGDKKVDPYQVVFMQRLRAGKYNTQFFWGDLRMGRVFQEIEKIVDSAVKWQQMADTQDNASAAMTSIYTAGMTEQIKRDGDRCSCGAYLGLFAYVAAKEGRTLDSCPRCNGSFNAPPPPTAADTAELCPNCGSDIQPRQRRCHGCRAIIDRSMAAGTVETTTTETTDEYAVYDSYSPWGGTYISYGYNPPAPLYPGVFYDPYEPIANIVAFGLLCAIL